VLQFITLHILYVFALPCIPGLVIVTRFPAPPFHDMLCLFRRAGKQPDRVLLIRGYTHSRTCLDATESPDNKKTRKIVSLFFGGI